MNTSILIFMLLVAPSHSDIDVQNNAVQVGSYQTMLECAEASVSYDVAFCVPAAIEVAQ